MLTNPQLSFCLWSGEEFKLSRVNQQMYTSVCWHSGVTCWQRQSLLCSTYVMSSSTSSHVTVGADLGHYNGSWRQNYLHFLNFIYVLRNYVCVTCLCPFIFFFLLVCLKHTWEQEKKGTNVSMMACLHAHTLNCDGIVFLFIGFVCVSYQFNATQLRSALWIQISV